MRDDHEITDVAEEDMPIGEFLDLLTQNLTELVQTTQHIETVLSEALASDTPFGTETIRVLQRLDFARQSSGDILSMVELCAPQLTWRAGAQISRRALVDVVDMKNSAVPQEDRANDTTDESDIWF